MKKWIQGAINPAHKGDLHRALGIPLGTRIPGKKLKTAAGKSGRVGKMAKLAETLRGFHKK